MSRTVRWAPSHLRLTLMAMALLAAGLATSNPAQAAAISCQNPPYPPQSRFAGTYYGGPVHRHGASAVISHRWGVICDTAQNTSENFNTVWSMMAGSAVRYAQIGVTRGWNQPSNFFFYEYQNASGQRRRQDLFPVADGTNRFWVQLVPPADGVPNWHYRLNIDNTIQGVTWWDPYSAQGFNAPYALPEWAGETKYVGTAMPGTTYNPTRFDSLQVQNFGAGGGEFWSSQYSGDSMGPASPGGYPYGFAWTFSDSFKVWQLGA